MTILKLKSIIYRYTGVYLANQEENDYLTSMEFWKSFNEYRSHEENDMCDYNIQGLMIGSWQSNHGFCRPYSKYRVYHRSPMAKLINTFSWFHSFYTMAKWDLKDLIRKVKK
jgi:hypothetical protein